MQKPKNIRRHVKPGDIIHVDPSLCDFGTPTWKPAPPAALKDLDAVMNLIGLLFPCLCALEGVADRLLGQRPPAVAGEASKSPPVDGLVHQIRVELSHAHARLDDVTRRLENLA